MVFTGGFNYIQWGEESCFNCAVTQACINKPFGFEQRITSHNFTQNRINVAQLDDIRLKTYAYGQTRGTLGVEFVMSNPWWLSIAGFKDGGCFPSGCGPYTYTWDLANDSCTEIIRSASIEVGQESGCTDIVRTLTGAIVNTTSISTTIGETAKVTMDMNYANEALTTCLDCSPASESVCCHIPFTFAHGELITDPCNNGLCCGTTVAEVQESEITLNQNPDHLWGIGNSVAVNAYRRLFELTGRFRTSWTDDSLLAELYEQQKDTLCNKSPAVTQSSEMPALRLVFCNGLSGTCQRQIQFDFTGISFADHNLSIEPNEPVFEELNWQARDCDVTAINNTSAFP